MPSSTIVTNKYPRATRLEEALEIRGMTQTELARRLGCSQSAISLAARDYNALSKDKWLKIAMILDVSLDGLFLMERD